MTTLREAKDHLARLEPFDAGNLWAINSGGSYEVFSYSMNIASCPAYAPKREDLHLVETTPSKTTCKHLNIVRQAWGI